jgi:hypothetical protein
MMEIVVPLNYFQRNIDIEVEEITKFCSLLKHLFKITDTSC